MFELKFLGATSTYRENTVHVHFKVLHIGNSEGTRISLRIETTIPSSDVNLILMTKNPANWYLDLIAQIEKQFAELSRLALS
ncbi:hypothetical protein ACLSU7_02930 [Bdellovibrio sp. HCB185ZH]|uniref:hypothetical protein n=1 Tax=Bdellovibrio sp. HCB185ZH TaxID=3394235 RepID=UPI0039A716C4